MASSWPTQTCSKQGYGHLRWHGFSLEGTRTLWSINRNRFRLMNTTMRYQSNQLWGLLGTLEWTMKHLIITADSEMEDKPEQTARLCLQSIVLAILINNNISAIYRLVSYSGGSKSRFYPGRCFPVICLYHDDILQSKTQEAFARTLNKHGWWRQQRQRFNYIRIRFSCLLYIIRRAFWSSPPDIPFLNLSWLQRYVFVHVPVRLSTAVRC